MTIAHKNLTGTDLHEIKGASTAVAGQIPIANGSGGAPFGTLGASSLTGTANPFGAQLLHIYEQVAAGGASATASTTGTWVTNFFTVTATNEIGASISASTQINLPAGTFFLDAVIPYNISASGTTVFFKSRLFNSTTGGQLLLGPQAVLNVTTASGSVQGIVTLRGRFTLAAPSALFVQHFKTYPTSPVGGGTSGSAEIYTEALIWRVA